MLGRHGNRRRGAAIAEFGPVLWMFMLLFVVPFLDLISFGTAMATIMYEASMGAHLCSGAQTFTDAINGAKGLEAQCGKFMALAKVTPIDASGNPAANGMSVAVIITPLDGSGGPPPYYAPGSGGGKIPNQTPDPGDTNPPQYNTTNCVYQYIITCRYNVLPMFNFCTLPFLKNVPGLGKAVPVTYSATAPVEHIDGLNN